MHARWEDLGIIQILNAKHFSLRVFLDSNLPGFLLKEMAK